MITIDPNDVSINDKDLFKMIGSKIEEKKLVAPKQAKVMDAESPSFMDP